MTRGEGAELGKGLEGGECVEMAPSTESPAGEPPLLEDAVSIGGKETVRSQGAGVEGYHHEQY